MQEIHIILKGATVGEVLEKQRDALDANSGFSFALKRWFLSCAEQKAQLPVEAGAVSYIIQPPLDGSAVALWLYLVSGARMEYGAGFTKAVEDGREFVWRASMTADGLGSAEQTTGILEDYEKGLDSAGLSLESNCVRTWFFVTDIDNNYSGLVRARRENFVAQGLTPQTHYIASTGIAGTSATSGALVQMDAYSIKGDFRQTYLYAPDFLNPTYEYGVTFERGVRLDCGDHVQILISGTASIDNKGQVLHIGDVRAQALRMFENVQALLSEAGACWSDVRQMIVYLRNSEDYGQIAPLYAERFPDIPYIITHAPVCRPDWLIEMECIATL